MVNKITDGDLLLMTVSKGFSEKDRETLKKAVTDWLRKRDLMNVEFLTASVDSVDLGGGIPVQFVALSANDPVDSLLKGTP